MPRPATPHVMLSLRLTLPTHDALANVAARTGRSKTAIIEDAVRAHLGLPSRAEGGAR